MSENSKFSTSENAAKNQHLIPQTYMKNWCYSGNSVWTIDKGDANREICSHNIERINSINNYHDIKAGDIFTTPESLDHIFGWLDKYDINFEGSKLDHESLNRFYTSFDNWIIKSSSGNVIYRKQRNKIKDILKKARYTYIETEWSKQYENGWNKFIKEVEKNIISISDGGSGELTSDHMEMLMTYLVMFDWRSNKGNSILNEILDTFCIVLPAFQTTFIPSKDRIHNEDETQIDEIRNAYRRKSYYEFLNKKGTMKTYVDLYFENLTLSFCITDSSSQFITSDNPSFMFTNKNNWKEHVLVALPTLLLTTRRSAKKGAFQISKLSANEVMYYNQKIAENGQLLILPNNQFNVQELLIG